MNLASVQDLNNTLLHTNIPNSSGHSQLIMCKGRVVQEHDEHKHELKLTGTEHMVIIVSFGDGSIWLTDVGFGGQVARRPLRIDQIELDPPQDSRTYGNFPHFCVVDMVVSPFLDALTLCGKARMSNSSAVLVSILIGSSLLFAH